MAPVVPAAADGEEPLVPDDLGHDLEADPLQALRPPRRHGRRRARRSPTGREGTRANASDQSTRVSPLMRGVAMARVRPWAPPGARVASSAVGLAIDRACTSARRDPRALYTPSRHEPSRLTRRRADRSSSSVGSRAVEEPGHVLGARGVPAQQAMLAELPEIAGLRPGCPARLLQRLVEVERLLPLALLADLQASAAAP